MSERIEKLTAVPKIDGVWLILVVMIALLWMVDGNRWSDVMTIAVNAFAGTMVYVVFAVLVLAVIIATGAERMISQAFEGREVKMIFAASLIGGLAPFCSCEVIPFIAGLLRMGVPLSGVMAFWLSSPLIDPPTLLITAAALGWSFALAKAIVAIVLGLGGGFAIYVLSNRFGFFTNPLKIAVSGDCSSCQSDGMSGPPVWRFWHHQERIKSFKKAVKDNAFFLIKWLAFAYFLEGLMITYVPADLIKGLVGGNGISPVIISAFIGAPAYLNSYVAPPLVAGLMNQGMGAGAAMAFMVAGAVSSIPAMAAVYSLVRIPVFAAYLGLGILGAIIAGLTYGAFVQNFL